MDHITEFLHLWQKDQHLVAVVSHCCPGRVIQNFLRRVAPFSMGCSLERGSHEPSAGHTTSASSTIYHKRKKERKNLK